MKITLTWIGQPKDVQTKFGPKQKFSVKATQYGDNYLDVWSSPVTREWKVGQEVEVLSVDTREYSGKTYYDVKMPKANAGNNEEVMKKLETISNEIVKVKLVLAEVRDVIVPKPTPKVAGTDIDYPQMEAEPNFDVEEDAPF
jgi:hypothetical protein